VRGRPLPDSEHFRSTPRTYAFERTLVTPSRFDAFLAGDARALSPQERTGLRKFIDTGCIACHNGVDVGGGMFQKFGVVEDYWTATESQQPDKGRFDVTHDPQDNLRVQGAESAQRRDDAPYFHDGSVRSDQDTADIAAFLGSLTGKLPQGFVDAPILPASGFDVSQTEAPQQHR
jgi:cytochrome c peroxidase